MTGPDAYTSGSPAGDGPTFTRVYRPRGRLAHLRPDESSAGVLCERPGPAGGTSRRITPADVWRGTGSQAEYDRAAALPLCPACFTVREARLPDPRLGTGHREVLA